MGRKSRQKRMRKVLRPGVRPGNPEAADNPGRRATSASGKVMRLLEAMVDAAQEDLSNGAVKPRVSYGQALRAAELLMRYESEQEDAELEQPAEAEPEGKSPSHEADFDAAAETQQLDAPFAGPQMTKDEQRALAIKILGEVAAEHQPAQTG